MTCFTQRSVWCGCFAHPARDDHGYGLHQTFQSHQLIKPEDLTLAHIHAAFGHHSCTQHQIRQLTFYLFLTEQINHFLFVSICLFGIMFCYFIYIYLKKCLYRLLIPDFFVILLYLNNNLKSWSKENTLSFSLFIFSNILVLHKLIQI